jgi:RimJ/RimL family protein N-acetyltransferase
MIAREHQRQGFGRAAMFEMIDWVRELGLPRMITSVVDGNTAAFRFYKGFGFAL